jgi:hypothetical protein
VYCEGFHNLLCSLVQLLASLDRVFVDESSAPSRYFKASSTCCLSPGLKLIESTEQQRVKRSLITSVEKIAIKGPLLGEP